MEYIGFTKTIVVTTIIRFAALAGIVLTLLIAVPGLRRLSGDYVVDPKRPFNTHLTPDSHLTAAVIWSHPATYIVLGLAAVLLVATVWRLVHLFGSSDVEYIGLTWIVPLVAAGVLIMAGIGIGDTLSTDSTDHTFATWAKQRYGIEMEAYPTETRFFDPEGVSTSTVVTLDDGQQVAMDKITDARSKETYIIVDASTGRADHELKTRVDD